MLVLEIINLLTMLKMMQKHILIVSVLSIFLKRLNSSQKMKSLMQIFLEFRHMIQ